MTNQQILLKYWGYSHFRPLQEDIIASVNSGKDTLALMPTGGGKSICFQVPTLSKDGICIVISPLIALMKDQVEGLKEKGIKAMAITSVMSSKEIDIAFDNCVYGGYKFLYLSPERLSSDLAKARIKKMNVSLIAVDEAHCVSQWGYDFRPSYLKIAEIREILSAVPILALTATATPEVVEDIQKKLLFKKANVLKKSFERENLAYVVIHEEDKLNRMLKVITKVSGSGIVYVRNRKKTHEVSELLRANHILADYYHAGLEPKIRDEKQEAWIQNKIQVIVCTNAFGMGIDKPDVRFVVHLDLPDCLESYFQEAGRAGRDGKKAYAVLLYQDSDKIDAEYNLKMSYPELSIIKKTYQALANYFQIPIGVGQGSTFDFDIIDFCAKYNLEHVLTFNALKFLEREGYLVLSDAFHSPSRIHFVLNKEELYKFQVEHTSYDDFIKMLLRSHAGLFDAYVKISEYEFGKRIGKSFEVVQKELKELEKLNVLTYVPQSNMPQVLFFEPRVDANSIHISEEILSKQKKKSLKRKEAIIHYVESKTKCRSQLLLNYFGDVDSYRCGICDVCLERNKLDLSNLEFEKISNQIKKIVSANPILLKELVDSIKEAKEDRSIKVIQWLIDNEKLCYDSENRLYWKK